MSGHRSFKELTKDWSAERKARVKAGAAEILSEIDQAALVDLRKALHVSQEELGRALGKSQAAVAQMEQRTDMRVSTLRETIEAMGGQLELVAHFPEGDVKIARLGEAAE